MSIKNENDQFAEEIFESRLMSLSGHTIWPREDHEEPNMEGAEGENIIDYLEELAGQNPDGYRAVQESISKRSTAKPAKQ